MLSRDMRIWCQSTATRFFFYQLNNHVLAVKILLSFMFELKQMEAIDSDELKGNPFFCSSAREQCTCQLNLNRVIVCCYLSWWIRYFFLHGCDFSWSGYVINNKAQEMFLTDWKWEEETFWYISLLVPLYCLLIFFTINWNFYEQL